MKFFLNILLICNLAFVLSSPLDRLPRFDDGSEAEYGSHFEGDMILDADQLEALSPVGRNGLIDTKYRWLNKVVPYELNPNHTKEQNDYIELGLKTIASVSCVKFVRRTNQVDYVKMMAGNGGCYSQVGRAKGAQTLNLSPQYEPGTGCFRLGTIMHEYLHALGFYHMQSAHDRDEYVQIKWENIQEGTENNFNKYSAAQVSHFEEKYDYSSVMHYSAKAFSKNGEPTIVPLNKMYLDVIGQREKLSEVDIKKLNRMYECEEEVETSA